MTVLKDQAFTLTADDGKAFSCHADVSSELGAPMYFAKPYHSWERGLNEHTNGLVRQYFPKSKRFDSITDEDLLNARPRKVLGFRTPLEVFTEARKAATVALQC